MQGKIITAEQYRNLRRLHSYFDRERARGKFDQDELDRRTIVGLGFIERWRAHFRARAALKAAPRQPTETTD